MSIDIAADGDTLHLTTCDDAPTDAPRTVGVPAGMLADLRAARPEVVFHDCLDGATP